MIDTKELRKKLFYLTDLTLEAWVIEELLDRIEAAEKERDDLLKALKWMVLRTEEGGYPDGKCLEEARAAIARATGEQP